MAAEGKSARTIRDHCTMIRRFERDTAVPIIETTTADVARWLGRPGLSLASRSVYHSILVQFYRWAVNESLVGTTPMTSIRAAPRPK